MGVTNYPDFSDVVLIGGTGRSGTTITGKLLSRHPEVKHSQPTEIKFLTSGNGLIDLAKKSRFTRKGKLILGKNAHFNRFKRDVQGKWWIRDGKKGGKTGLSRGIEETSMGELLAFLNEELLIDRNLACANFMRRFVDYQLQGQEIKYWIDTTPPNLMFADEISNLMPGVRFIHLIRDGRDVASSVVRERWGPNEHSKALIWWHARLESILRATKTMPDKVLHVWLEDLTIHDRENQLKRILEFLNLKPAEKLSKYFETEVTAENAHTGRWRKEVANTTEFEAKYEALLQDLYGLGLPKPMKQI